MDGLVRRIRAGIVGVTLGIGLSVAVNPVPSAQAAVGTAYVMYATIDGIRGHAPDAPGSIEILAMSYGVSSQQSATAAGGSASREVAGKPVSLDIQLTKRADEASTYLLADLTTGKVITGKIYVQTMVNQKRVTVMQLSFTGLVSSFNQSVSEGSEVMEEVAIHPLTETLTVTPINSDGSTKSSSSTTYDVSTNKTT